MKSIIFIMLKFLAACTLIAFAISFVIWGTIAALLETELLDQKNTAVALALFGVVITSAAPSSRAMFLKTDLKRLKQFVFILCLGGAFIFISVGTFYHTSVHMLVILVTAGYGFAWGVITLYPKLDRDVSSIIKAN